MKRHVMIAATLAALALPGFAVAADKPSADDKNMLSRDAFGPDTWRGVDRSAPAQRPAQPRVIVVPEDSVIVVQDDSNVVLRSNERAVDKKSLQDVFQTAPYGNE